MKKGYNIRFFCGLLLLIVVLITANIREIFGEESPEETLEEGDVVIRTSPDGRMDDWWGIPFTKSAGHVGIYVGNLKV